ncbi:MULTISPECIES: FAD-dependent oxidoreductase [unclassified Microbacterium]|uniref:flavin monoamine oxidase family protein n=1 Tax=unclassified Microbacterium TaxID=2609290 RepID=UPI000CFD18D0|nr:MULTISPECIES: FAD-dependent oxidoreductase [unclassified Microbacterium]PQZ61326.1 amine oxidase [Microbacterium sp. MYb43]PQZ82537.1 amine oxidase [Microbacterium sp. MYb40]PRB23763.1 amine oxidase [Microbacterium sp. MYb54]PRB29658.1 amine oxidase [Microbacterium sp. MYb50]PRB70984.1 amine oxidase [Microbacterium sp. MYb24]
MSTFDTIVIGAGMSGLTSARMLVDAGQRVVVLEGRDRIGGRMHTDRSAGFPVDLGASWIHGIEGSPLWNLVHALRIPAIEYTVGSFQVGGRPIENFDGDGNAMDTAATAQWIADVDTADRLLVEEIAASSPGDTYLDVTERALDRSGIEPERIDDIREFFRHRVEEQCGAWIGDLDAHGLDEDAIDGDEVIFPRGYDELPRRIGAELDIRLGTTVTRVVRSSDGVMVHAGDTEYEADRVIVTVPLGILKADTIAFEPALPDAVAGPISRLGMGVFNKVFVQFPERFWDEESYVLRALGEAGEHWHSWYDVSAVSGIPTLLTFAAGPFGRRMQELSDEDIVADAVSALRLLYPDTVGDPIAHWITRWGHDQFSNGSYSHLAVGSTHHDHDALAGPVDGVLHFAGEATWGDEPATVGAAFYSGRRAAERILDRPVDLDDFASRIIERERTPAR